MAPIGQPTGSPGASAPPPATFLAPTTAGGPGGSHAPSIGDLLLPGLLAGIPLVVIIAILAAQLAAGASWVQLSRRWLGFRRLRDRIRPSD